MTDISIIPEEEIIKTNFFRKENTFVIIEPEGYLFEYYMTGVENILINICEEDISTGIMIYLPNELLENVSNYTLKEIKKHEYMNILQIDNNIAITDSKSNIQVVDELKIGDINMSIGTNECKDILITGNIEQVDIGYNEFGLAAIIFLPIELIKFISDNLGVHPIMERDFASMYLGKNIKLRDVSKIEISKADTERIGTDEALVYSYFKDKSIYPVKEFRKDDITVHLEGPSPALMGDTDDYDSIIEGVPHIYIDTYLEDNKYSSSISIDITNQLLNDVIKYLMKNLDKNIKRWRLDDNIVISDLESSLTQEIDKLKIGGINISIGPTIKGHKEILITQEKTNLDLSNTMLVVIRNMIDPDISPEITIYLPIDLIKFIGDNFGLNIEEKEELGKIENVLLLGDIRLKSTSVLYDILRY